MSFKKKIDMILEARKLQRLTINKIEKLLGVDGTIYKAYKDDREPADSEIVRKLIGKLGIRQAWWDKEWESDSKEIFNTSVRNEPAVAEKPTEGDAARIYEELYEKFLGTNSEYLMIHRDILKEHRLVAVKQLETNAKELDNLTAYIQTMQETIKDLATRPINIQFSDVKKI